MHAFIGSRNRDSLSQASAVSINYQRRKRKARRFKCGLYTVRRLGGRVVECSPLEKGLPLREREVLRPSTPRHVTGSNPVLASIFLRRRGEIGQTQRSLKPPSPQTCRFDPDRRHFCSVTKTLRMGSRFCEWHHEAGEFIGRIKMT